MNASSRLKSAWKSARLFMLYQRNRNGEVRDEPLLWPTKTGSATLPANPQTKAILAISGDGGAGDVQVLMRPDRIALQRGWDRLGWTDILANHDRVSVLLGDLRIEIGPDGSVTREAAEGTTRLEGDGSILKVSDGVEITVSPDGGEVARRTAERIEGLTAGGIVSRLRQPVAG